MKVSVCGDEGETPMSQVIGKLATIFALFKGCGKHLERDEDER